MLLQDELKKKQSVVCAKRKRRKGLDLHLWRCLRYSLQVPPVWIPRSCERASVLAKLFAINHSNTADTLCIFQFFFFIVQIIRKLIFVNKLHYCVYALQIESKARNEGVPGSKRKTRTKILKVSKHNHNTFNLSDIYIDSLSKYEFIQREIIQ